MQDSGGPGGDKTQSKPFRYTLAPRLDHAAALPLASELRKAPDARLIVDAGQVDQLGTLCAQVLIAAAHSRRNRGGMQITPRSAAFDAALAGLGIEPLAVESRSAEWA